MCCLRIVPFDSCRLPAIATAAVVCLAGNVAAQTVAAQTVAAQTTEPSRDPRVYRVSTSEDTAATAQRGMSRVSISQSNPQQEPTPAEPTIVSPKPSFPDLSISAQTHEGQGRADEKSLSKSAAGPLITMGSSLAVVLGLFAGLVWVSRRFGGKRSAEQLPKEAVENLGSHVIDARTRLLLIRCGQRVLVVSQTATGIQPISEITNPDEVSRLISNCRSDNRSAFDQTLRSMEREPASPGFVGSKPSSSNAASTGNGRGRLFATA